MGLLPSPIYIIKYPCFLRFHFPTKIIFHFQSIPYNFSKISKTLSSVAIHLRVQRPSSGLISFFYNYLCIFEVLWDALTPFWQWLIWDHFPLPRSCLPVFLMIKIPDSGSYGFSSVVHNFGFFVVMLHLLILLCQSCQWSKCTIVCPLFHLYGLSYPPGCSEYETSLLIFFLSVLPALLVTPLVCSHMKIVPPTFYIL